MFLVLFVSSSHLSWVASSVLFYLPHHPYTWLLLYKSAGVITSTTPPFLIEEILLTPIHNIIILPASRPIFQFKALHMHSTEFFLLWHTRFFFKCSYLVLSVTNEFSSFPFLTQKPPTYPFFSLSKLASFLKPI